MHSCTTSSFFILSYVPLGNSNFTLSSLLVMIIFRGILPIEIQISWSWQVAIGPPQWPGPPASSPWNPALLSLSAGHLLLLSWRTFDQLFEKCFLTIFILIGIPKIWVAVGDSSVGVIDIL